MGRIGLHGDGGEEKLEMRFYPHIVSEEKIDGTDYRY